MLFERLLTIIILLPLFILALLFLDTFYFGLLCAGIVIIGAWEWTQLIPLTTAYCRMAYVTSVIVLLYLLQFVPIKFVLIAGLVWWILAAISVYYYSRKISILEGKPLLKMIIGYLVLIPFWFAMVSIHSLENGHQLLLYALFLVWATDSGGYIFGRLFGKHKLLPQVSPGKTIEGFIGGLLLAFIVCYAASILFEIDNRVFWITLGMLVSIIAVLGDLTESMMKRLSGVKDSGQLLPGHGGILDRFDSLTAALPLFAFSLMV